MKKTLIIRRQQVTRTGIVYRLVATPKFVSPVYQCPLCQEYVYDGAVPRFTICMRCHKPLIREEGSEPAYFPISFFNEKINANTLAEVFKLVIQQPAGESVAVELDSVTFGVFEESLGQYGAGNYDRVVREVLAPWLLAAQRCVGVNDVLECRELRVKVLAAQPFWGFVGRRTAIMCDQTLSMQPLQHIVFDLLLPSDIEAEVQSIFAEYFFHRPMHIHTGMIHPGQYISFQGLEGIVIECQPNNNGIAQNANVRLNTMRIPPLFNLLLGRFEETETDCMESYIKPYFSGWRRFAENREEFSIGGKLFKVLGLTGSYGYVGPLTRISVVQGVLSWEKEAQIDQFMQSLNGMRRMNIKPGDHLPVHQLATLPASHECSCTICDCDFELGDSVKTLPCCNPHAVHVFHEKCVDLWFQKKRECPLCQHPVDQIEGTAT